uniref:PA domain-containing protein n=1 Tax=Parascaris equorum TaxID=6256 RepID=A0A914S6Y5_PAREQ
MHERFSSLQQNGTSSGDESVDEGPDENIGKQLHTGIRAWYPYPLQHATSNAHFSNTSSNVRRNATSAGVQWIAYSGNGTAQGEVVYCHYGRVEDFERLDRLGVTVKRKGKIALLRYGNGFRGDKVRNAQMNGATGAILYSDPAEVARMGPYPAVSSSWKNCSNIQRMRSSAKLPEVNDEDSCSETICATHIMALSTIVQFYNSEQDSRRPQFVSFSKINKMYLKIRKIILQAKNDGTLPTIPVLPIGYSDAFQILSRMQGRMVPLDWQGGLNISYRLGPRIGDGATVRIDVRSSLQTRYELITNLTFEIYIGIYAFINEGDTRSFFHSGNEKFLSDEAAKLAVILRTIRNVIGYIHGADDPDRYVILGNHFDAWVYGSIDPNSGTAVLAEVARAITQTINETNWRPGITLLGYGNGMTAEFANILTQRAVVYLNVDNIHSNASLHVKGAMSRSQFNSYCRFASTVPTLYQKVTEVAKRIPNPVVAEVKRGRKTVYDTWSVTYFNSNATTYDTYPLYHSLYETPFVNEHIFDTNNFAVHVAVGQYWAELAREFTDSAVLPFNISDLANSLLRIYLPNLKRAMEPLKYRADEIKDAREQLSRLIKNCQNYVAEKRLIAYKFAEFLRRAEAFSLVIKQALRNFAINPQPSQRHVLFSTSDRDSYTGRVMAAVYDQYSEGVLRKSLKRSGTRSKQNIDETLTRAETSYALETVIGYTRHASLFQGIARMRTDNVDAFVESKTHRERQLAARNIATEISLIQYAVQCASNTIADRIYQCLISNRHQAYVPKSLVRLQMSTGATEAFTCNANVSGSFELFIRLLPHNIGSVTHQPLQNE